MSDFPLMVYKAGGPHEIHGAKFDYLIAEDADELAGMLADGWHLTTTEAAEAAKAEVKPQTMIPDPVDDNVPPTRAELEQKATELGIEFSPRIGDTKLAERIAEKLKA